MFIADNISRPVILKRKIYEVDEIKTFIRKKNKPTWIVYALEKESKKVVSFYVGSRTNKTLNSKAGFNRSVKIQIKPE